MAGFLGSGVPLYEIADAYRPDDIQDMLVRNVHLGAALATCFLGGEKAGHLPKHAVTLMRGHGFTVVAENIEECVLRAVYTQKNAMIQTAALTTCNSSGGNTHNIRYLSEKESAAATNMTKWSAQRPWKLWLREVESCGLYVNSA